MVIGKIPRAECVTDNLIPANVIKTPVSITFNNDIVICGCPDLKWYRDAVMVVKSITHNKSTLLKNLSLDYILMLNNAIKVLAQKMIARIPRFVKNHMARN